MEQNNKELQIELSPEKAAGTYSNLTVITHGANEFFLDFITVAPNVPKAQVQSRIVLNPENAKNLMFALMDNVKKYEETFGEITRTVPRQHNTGNDGNIPNPFIGGGKLN
ncbi:MAG: DUF3467 domain-containing protein [Paramuribaculum sp.]|nr:DUF3467 domain-containing protein [Paramuribaculum sp.]